MNKAVCLGLILVSLLVFGMSSSEIDKTVLGQAQTNVSTIVTITGVPPEAWADELVHVRVEIDPLPPISNDQFTNFNFTVTNPDKTTETVVNANNSAVAFPLGGNVIDDYFNVSRGMVGAFIIKLNFAGQEFGNGVYYLPSENETSLNITTHSHPLPASPSPTSTSESSPSPSQSIPEFPTLIAPPLIATVTLLTAKLLKKKKR